MKYKPLTYKLRSVDDWNASGKCQDLRKAGITEVSKKTLKIRPKDARKTPRLPKSRAEKTPSPSSSSIGCLFLWSSSSTSKLRHYSYSSESTRGRAKTRDAKLSPVGRGRGIAKKASPQPNPIDATISTRLCTPDYSHQIIHSVFIPFPSCILADYGGLNSYLRFI